MPTWNVVYQNGYEAGFYDQDGVGELTIPLGHAVEWDQSDGMPRPECDAKDRDAGQSEVFAGRYSASVFTVYARHDAWLISEPIPVTPDVPTRASAYGMIVCHGVNGDNNIPGDQGVVLGIGTTPDRMAATFGEWWAVRDTLDNERVWHRLETPEITPHEDQVFLFLRTRANWAATINAAHFDMEVVEQLGGDPPLPGGLQEHIDQLRADLDALQEYVDTQSVTCLVVG